MNSFCKKITSAILCTTLLIAMLSGTLSCTATNTAASKESPVRVGWYPLNGSQEYDKDGNPCGYSYDCLQALSRHTGLTFEYVNGSFSECLSLLKSGDLDLMLFVQYTPERGEQLSFCDVPLCKVSSFLTCEKELAGQYTGKESLEGKTIAVVNGSYQEKELRDFMLGSGVNYTVLPCRLTSDALQTVNDGISDFALIPSVVRLSPQQVVVESLNVRFASMAVAKDDQALLHRLNTGLSSILDVDPSFFKSHYEAHFGGSRQDPFTLSKEEKQAVANLGTLHVCLDKDAGYLSRYEDGVWCGIRADVVKLISQKLGIPYQFIADDISDQLSQWNQADGIDLVAGFYFDYNWAKQAHVSISSPYLTHKYYSVKNKDYTGTYEEATVAVLQAGDYFTDTILLPNLGKAQILRFDSIQDCLAAVDSNRADMTFLSSYMAEYYTQGYEYPNLTTSITEYASQVCFAAPEKIDPLLLSAVNKAIESISNTEIQAIILRNTAPITDNFSMKTMIYRNPVLFFGVSGFLLLVLLLTLVVFLYSRKLQAKNKELQAANETKSAFFSRMSHDMRTPMNAILSFSQMAQEESQENQTKKYLSDIHSSGEYLLCLINDVLDIQKMDYQGIVLHPELVDMDDVFPSIFDMIQPILQQKEISFHSSFNKGGFDLPRFCSLDPLRFRQIFINLLSNASKFTPKGGEIFFYVVILHYENGIAQTEFTVRDTGIGMSESFQEKMFEPFTQEDTNKTSTYTGTGLGLSIVKKLVDGIGGSIRCQSKQGEGTSMIVTLPLHLVENPSTQPVSTPYDDRLLKGKRILLCEDHPMNIKIAEKLLSKKGLLVEVAENGQLGLHRFLSAPQGYYDAILMDIRMPVMDGLDTTRAIRASQHPDAETIPILAMTANAFPEDIKESAAAGMNAHLSKPIDPEALARALCQYTMQSKPIQQEEATSHDPNN